jgi:hypothetical protein
VNVADALGQIDGLPKLLGMIGAVLLFGWCLRRRPWRWVSPWLRGDRRG